VHLYIQKSIYTYDLRKLVSPLLSPGADKRLNINFLPFNFFLNFTCKKWINLERNIYTGIWHYFSTIAYV